MSIQLGFARTINDLDNRLPKGRGDCFDFGSVFGCKMSCPVLQRGECEIATEGDASLAKILWDDSSEGDEDEIIAMYPKMAEHFAKLLSE